MFNFVFLSPKRWFQFNSRIFWIHFASVMTLTNWEMTAETRIYIFRWRSRCRRRSLCVSSLLFLRRRRRRRKRTKSSQTQQVFLPPFLKSSFHHLSSLCRCSHYRHKRLCGYVIIPLCTIQCKSPHPSGRDIAGHLRGIFGYLTSERAANNGHFDHFCTSSKNSGGVGIFHRGVFVQILKHIFKLHLLTLNPLLLAWISLKC